MGTKVTRFGWNCLGVYSIVIAVFCAAANKPIWAVFNATLAAFDFWMGYEEKPNGR